MFLGKSLPKICSKFTGEHPCRSEVSIKSLCNLIEIAFRHGCSTINLLHIFRTPFPKNTSCRLPLTLLGSLKFVILKKSQAWNRQIFKHNSKMKGLKKWGDPHFSGVPFLSLLKKLWLTFIAISFHP